MKKAILVLTIVSSLMSCKPTAAPVSNKTPTPSIDNAAEVAFKGNWMIDKVTYIGSDYLKINSFQIADAKCFEGSTWKFISNNNKGDMALTAAGCPAFSSPIVWSVSKEKMFSLKILNDVQKAKEVKVGYYLLVQNQTPNSFELSDRVDVGGKLTEVVYHFVKN